MRAVQIISISICLFLCSNLACLVQASGTDDSFQVIIGVAGWAVVITNESTNIEETTATLNGFLIQDGGALCQYAFDYDVDSGEPYASSTVWVGAIHSPQAFSQGASSLTKGELYYFRAKVRNINGTSVGGEKKFLTKPDLPSDFHAVRNHFFTQIDLSWIKGGGADRTVIVRKVGSYPATRSDGLLAYNGTGSTYFDGAVIAGTHYYYRAWSYCSEGSLFQYSDNYDEDDCIALTPPTFDIHNIVIVDNIVPSLKITVQVENKGNVLVDITVNWVLIREDTGAVLDAGSDTFAISPHSVTTYTIQPTTSYVGLVRITFTGNGASAFEIFTTTSQITGGGGGITPKPPPTLPPPVPPTPLPAMGLGNLSYMLGIIILLILFVLFILYTQKNKKYSFFFTKRRKQ